MAIGLPRYVVVFDKGFPTERRRYVQANCEEAALRGAVIADNFYKGGDYVTFDIEGMKWT